MRQLILGAGAAVHVVMHTIMTLFYDIIAGVAISAAALQACVPSYNGQPLDDDGFPRNRLLPGWAMTVVDARGGTDFEVGFDLKPCGRWRRPSAAPDHLRGRRPAGRMISLRS